MSMFDMDDGYDIDDIDEAMLIQCKYCNQRYLWWTRTLKGWRLMDSDRKLHLCRSRSDNRETSPR